MKKYEQYSDMLSRLYADDYPINSHVKSIVFQITEDCNLCCTYCFQINKGHQSMSFHVAKSYVDYIFANAPDDDFCISYKNTIGLVIEFVGGEPLLHTDLIYQIMDYITVKMVETNSPWFLRHRFSICSNGVNYFDENVQTLIKNYQNRLSMNITVDGYKEMHDKCRVFPDGSGSYELALKASLDCKNTYGYEGTKITISPENVYETSKAIISMIQLGFSWIFANCVYEEGWTNHHAKILYCQLKIVADYILENNLYDELFLSIFDDSHFKPQGIDENENWCGGTDKMFALDSVGKIFPCIRYMKSSLGSDAEPFYIGDVKNGIGYNPVTKARILNLKSITRRSQSTDECFNCPIAKGCGVCSAYNYQIFKTANKRATFICQMHKARACASAYFHLRADAKYELHITDDMALEIMNLKNFTEFKKLQKGR